MTLIACLLLSTLRYPARPCLLSTWRCRKGALSIIGLMPTLKSAIMGRQTSIKSASTYSVATYGPPAMALIQSWMPPSREHWQLLSSIWQVFPLVCFLPHTRNIASWLIRKIVGRSRPVHHRLLSHGEDLSRVSLEPAGEIRMGAHGGPRLHQLVVYHVHTPSPEWDPEPASGELADGGAFCE